MPSIRSTFSPTAPQTTFASPEEEAQLAAVGQRSVLEGTPAFGAGLRRSLLTMPAGLSDALGQTLEPLYPEAAQPMFDWATANRQQAAAIPMPVQNFDDVNGVGDLGSYVAGKMGENAMNVVPAVVGGAAARYGLRGAAMSPLMKTGVGAAAASFPQQMGEGVGALREDPAILANTTPGQRLAAATLYGAATAPLEAPEEALLLNRAMGTGAAVKNVFKDGIKASMKDAVKHVAKAVPESALTEGVPEVVEQGMQQGMQGYYNPQRDTSKDAHDLKESFFGGWAAGGGTATVGRGADVAWAQGRGATDAIKGLLAPKTLPPGMAQADDRTVLDWDAQDNAERNSRAGALADRILNSDAADELKQAAAAFKDKVAAGANDAWTAMGEALGKHESVQRARANVDRFLTAAKNTYGDLHGEGKNTEFTAADRHIFGEMRKYLPPTSELAKPENTDRAAELYSYLKQHLINGTKEELPLHALEDDFGTPENLAEALGNMHGLLVRSGELEADDGFMSRIKTALASGKNADFAMANLVRNHTALDVDQPTPHEAIAIAQQIKKLMAKYPEMSPEKRAKFDTALKDQFGEKNVDKVLEALGAQRPALQEESKVENDEGVDPENRVVFDNGPRQSFHGSGADGGLWNLGHADPKVRNEITSRYHAALSKHKEQGEDVRSLTPDEYATVAGVSRADVAAQLGVSVDELKNHPARMLHVTEGAVGLAGDKLDLQTSDLVRLGKKTVKDTSTKVDLGTAQKLRAALGQKDFKAQRKALQELGFGNLTSVEGVEGKGFFAKQNLNHRGEGRFTLHMKDGSEITMTSYELIKEMRGRENVDVKANRPGGAAEMLRHFSMGMSSILSNPDVKAIDVYNGGKGTKKQTLHTPQADGSEVTAAELKQLQSAEHRNSFPEKFKQQLVDIAEAAKTATPEEKVELRKQYAAIKAAAAHEADVFGAFGKFFKLGQLGGKAQYIHHGQRAMSRGGFDAQKDYASSMEALEQLEQEVKQAQADAEAKQKQADAIKARAAKMPAGKKKTGLEERAEELEQEADDLFAQAEALEEEAIEARAELESPANGFAQALEGGDKTDMAGSADGEVADMANASQLASERKVRTHDESTKELLHPRGKPGEGGGPPAGKLSELVVRGLKMMVPNGVTGRDFTKPMQALLDKIAAAGKVSPGLANHFQPVLNAIGKAAQANKFVKRLDPEGMAKLEAQFQRYLTSALSALADKGKAEPTELRKAQMRAAYGKLKALHTESLGASDTYEGTTAGKIDKHVALLVEKMHEVSKDDIVAETVPLDLFTEMMDKYSRVAAPSYGFVDYHVQNTKFGRGMAAAARAFLLSYGMPVKDTTFVLHNNTAIAYMLYDPKRDVMSLSAHAGNTMNKLARGEHVTYSDKADLILGLFHEAAHKIDLSMTVDGETHGASFGTGRFRREGELTKIAETLMKRGGEWKAFGYPINTKLDGATFSAEMFAQLYAVYKMLPNELLAEAPILYHYLEEVDNAKTSEDKRAAIAGWKGGSLDEQFRTELHKTGRTYVGKTLHTRRAVGDREEARPVDNADTGRAAAENAERPEGAGVTPEEIKAVEQELTKLEKLGSDLHDLTDAVRRATGALRDAWVNGELDKPALVKALHDAMDSLWSAAGTAAAAVREKVREVIAGYKAAKEPEAAKVDREYGKRSGDEALEAAADAWFTESKANVKYRPDSQYAKRIKEVAKEITKLLDSPTEALDRTDEVLGNIGGFVSYPFYSKKHEEFYQFAIPEKYIGRLGDNPTFGELYDISVVVAAYDKNDGDLTVLGPEKNSTAYKDFRDQIEDTGVELAPTRLNNVSKENLTNMLGELHARLQMQYGQEHVSYKWERKTGASKGKSAENAVHATRFNSERPEGGEVTPEEIKAVEEYVEKVLGPDVAVEFAKVLLDKKTGKATAGSGQWYRDNGKAFVQLSLNAANPMSKAHHEAMHEFFQRLMESNPDAALVLSRAAAGAPIRRQLERFFHQEPNRAAIMKQLDSSDHERVAYMFQLWAAGKLKVGDQTESWFKKVANLFRKVFGVLSNDQKAEAIMQAFHNGKMSEPNAVAEVLAKDVARNDALYAAVKQASLPLVAAMKRASYSADGVLRGRGNKALQEIAEIFYNAPGDKGGISFMSARQQKEDQMLNRIKGIFAGADEKDTALVLEGLQTPGFKLSNDAKIRAIQERLVGKNGDGKTGFFKQMYDYLDEAGVPVEKRKNYFPRVWDVEAIQKNGYEFTKMVREDYHKATGKDMSAVEAATIQQSIVANKGADALTETEASIGFTPYMQAANARKLGFLTDERFQGFQSKDAIHILTTYVGHAVHRAEYARRFGNSGELLQDKLVEAAGIEADKFGKGGAKELETARKTVMDKYAADMKKFFADIKDGKDVERPRRPTLHNFIAEIAKSNPKLAKALVAEMNDPYKAVMAMEGTLGYDVNAKWRAFQANTIVYQNMRLLWMSLFSQFADPLGVLVRGGTINDAWDTFKRGAVGAVHGWRGTQATDEMSQLARNLGIVNANGILSQMGDAYSSIFLGKFAKKMNDRLFRLNGVEAFTQGTRVGAMASGIGFITRHLTNPGEHSQRYMEELFGTGYKKGDIELTADGKLDFTDRRIQEALMKYVDSCMLRPNAAMRPVWSSDPHYALFFHMKQFTYAFHKTIIDRAILEGKHGNYDPAFNLVLTYVPMMIAADFLRGILSNGGEEPPWKRNWGPGDYLASGVQRAGLLGVPQLGVDVLQWGPTELLGPAAQQVEKGIKTFNRSIAKDNALDRKAAATGRAADLAKAEKYDGVAVATKRTIRDALPIGEFAKRATYDELVN